MNSPYTLTLTVGQRCWVYCGARVFSEDTHRAKQYRSWSEAAHAACFLQPHAPGEITVRPARGPDKERP